MKKTLMLMAMTMTMTVSAQDADSLKMERLQEVVVSGVRTQKNAPYATANIKRQELSDFSTSGQELPFLFSRTPGVLAWSENGLGTGTTYMRIRGAADSRINVTLDGVPLNSPEDQCVFWANMNSYASLLGSVQIQRGVGTSTNGDGAFEERWPSHRKRLYSAHRLRYQPATARITPTILADPSQQD